MNEEMQNKVKDTILDILKRMNFTDVDVVLINSEEQSVPLFNIVTHNDSKFLIGQRGNNLIALQHLLRLIIRKELSQDRVNFLLDVNNYKREKDDIVIDVARTAAREAAMDKKAIVLREMTPYERRLVHMELAENENVVTESIGEGEDRKVVVKPADLLAS